MQDSEIHQSIKGEMMNNKKVSRREAVKNILMSSAAIATLPIVGNVCPERYSTKSSSVRWPNVHDTSEQIFFIAHQVKLLIEKTKGKFYPDEGNSFLEGVMFMEFPPKMMKDMRTTKNRFGESTLEVVHSMWGKAMLATDYHSNVFTLTTYVREGNERKKYVQIGEP